MLNPDDFTTIILNTNLPVPPTYTVLCTHRSRNTRVECQRQDYAEVAEVTEFANPSGSVSRTTCYFGTCPDCGKRYKFVARFMEVNNV